MSVWNLKCFIPASFCSSALGEDQGLLVLLALENKNQRWQLHQLPTTRGGGESPLNGFSAKFKSSFNPEQNSLKFSPVFITDNSPKTSEKILCAEDKSPGLYPALARQLRQAKLAGPCHVKSTLLVTDLCGWVNGTMNYFPTYLNCRCTWDVCAGFAFAGEKCSKVW